MSDLWNYDVDDDCMSSDDNDGGSSHKRKAEEDAFDLAALIPTEKRSKLRKRFGGELDIRGGAHSQDDDDKADDTARRSRRNQPDDTSDSDCLEIEQDTTKLDADKLLEQNTTNTPGGRGGQRGSRAKTTATAVAVDDDGSNSVLAKLRERQLRRQQKIDNEDDDDEDDIEDNLDLEPSPIVRRRRGVAVAATSEDDDDDAAAEPSPGVKSGGDNEVHAIKLVFEDKNAQQIVANVPTEKAFLKKLRKKFLAVATQRGWLPHPEATLRVEFDGDEVKETDTPSSLDLEDGYKLEVHYIVPKKL